MSPMISWSSSGSKTRLASLREPRETRLAPRVPDTIAVNPKITQQEMDQVDTWVGELEANNHTLTAKTKYYVEKGTGETLKEVGDLNGLRLDLQKVIGVGKKEGSPTY